MKRFVLALILLFSVSPLQAQTVDSFPVLGANKKSIKGWYGDCRGKRCSREHKGIDIYAPKITYVLAARPGVVESVRTTPLGGKVVWIVDKESGLRYYYAHLSHQLVIPGDSVKAGDIIGTVGNTGNAKRKPPHLHFGIYTKKGALNPIKVLKWY